MEYVQYKSDRYAYIFQMVYYSLMLFLGVNFTKLYFSMDGEFGIIELGGALGLLVTSIVLAMATKSYKELNPGYKKDYKFIMLAFAAIAFFWAAGEEISWGQHFFGTQTPEWLSKINGQNETNIHNINKKFFDRTLERLIGILCMVTAIQHFRKKEMFIGFRLPTFFLNMALFTILIYRKNENFHFEVWSFSYIFLFLYPVRKFLDKNWKEFTVVMLTILLLVIWVLVLRANMDTLYQSHNFYHEIRETSFSILAAFFGWQILQDVKNRYVAPAV